jgi:cobalt-zinc-cadmium efflux system membrane fusion protein
MKFKFLYSTAFFYMLFFALIILIAEGCGNAAVKVPDEKGKYVIPDSLLKTIKIDSVQKCQLINAITLTGQVDFNQDHVMKITPMISGNISDIKVMLGDYVQQGQVLGVIKSSEMAGYGNDYVNAESNVRVAEKNLDKTKDMYKSGLASMTDSLSAEVTLQQAKSELNRVNRVLKINGGSTQGDYVIKSPISGFVVEKSVNNNSTIRTDNNGSMFTISDLKNVWVWANVYESNISTINLGNEVDVTTLSYPGKIFKGKVDKIMNVLDPTNKVMKVRIALDNKDYLLKPQMFASVMVTNPENKQSICIPSHALIFDNSQYYVLVYNNKDDVKITPVKVTSAIGDKTYLSEGVEPGQRIIASQAILIYDALNN